MWGAARPGLVPFGAPGRICNTPLLADPGCRASLWGTLVSNTTPNPPPRTPVNLTPSARFDELLVSNFPPRVRLAFFRLICLVPCGSSTQDPNIDSVVSLHVVVRCHPPNCEPSCVDVVFADERAVGCLDRPAVSTSFCQVQPCHLCRRRSSRTSSRKSESSTCLKSITT